MTDYEKDLDELLKDPEFAAGYLTAAIDEDDRDALLLAMRRVAQAMGGMTAVAERAHIKRENLYRTLGSGSNSPLFPTEDRLRDSNRRRSFLHRRKPTYLTSHFFIFEFDEK